MATFELVVEETGRFDVVDAHDVASTVLEFTECFYRVSVTKRYAPIRGATTHRLEDGTPVRHSRNGYFDTLDGLKRFFVIHAKVEEGHAC